MTATTDHDLVPFAWDSHNINDGVNYQAGFAPALEWGLGEVEVATLCRAGSYPIVTGVSRVEQTLQMVVKIVDSTRLRLLRDQLLRWFDPDDETPKKLTVTDADGTNSRYLEAIVETVKPLVGSGEVASPDLFLVFMKVHGDQKWRSTEQETPPAQSISSSPHTFSVVNRGSADAYPIYRFTPTGAKTGGYAWSHFVRVWWKGPRGESQRPLCITVDTASWVSGGYCRPDGNDLRVFLDGQEVRRDLVNMNTASTDIWISVDWQPTLSYVLATALTTAPTISSIELTEDIDDLPEEGILGIDSEVFYYRSRNKGERKVLEITRGAFGSPIESHAAGASVKWIQHDIQLVMGNPTASAPSYEAMKKPAINLSTSSNTLWRWLDGSTFRLHQPGSWNHWNTVTLSGARGVYTKAGVQLASGDTVEVLGAFLNSASGRESHASGWWLYSGIDITNFNWSGRVRDRYDKSTTWSTHVRYWPVGAGFWRSAYIIPEPASVNVWTNWSYISQPVFLGSEWVALICYFSNVDVEASRVDVTFDSSQIPEILVLPRRGNYKLSCVLKNETTGLSLSLSFNMALTDTLELDTEQKICRLLSSGAYCFDAITSFSTVRRDWLALVPGTNRLTFTDTGTTGLTLEVIFRTRSY